MGFQFLLMRKAKLLEVINNILIIYLIYLAMFEKDKMSEKEDKTKLK